MGAPGVYVSGTSSNSPNPLFIYDNCGSYNVTLTVTDANGNSDSFTGTAVVDCGPVANFSVSNACCGDIVTFTDLSSTAAGPPIQWAWMIGGTGTYVNGTNSSSQNPQYIFDSCGFYNVTLTVMDMNGTSSDTTIPIAVYAGPSAGFMVNPNPSCLGETTVCTDLSTQGAIPSGTINQWIWDNGTGVWTSTVQNPSWTYASPGTYNVTLMVTDNNGCTDDTTQTVNVVACCDSIEMVVNPLSNQDTIKLNGLANNIAPATVSSWQWDLSNISGTISSNSILQDPMFAINSADTFIVCLTSTINNSGAMQTCIVCDTLIWNSAWVSYSMGNSVLISDFIADTVCLGTSTNFTNLSVGGTPPYMYLWDFGDGTTSTAPNPSHLYVMCGIYNVSLIVVDANGLSDTSINSVVVNCPPVANFSSMDVCEGDINIFTDLSNSPATIVSLFWDFGDGTTSMSQNPSHVYANCGTYNVTLIVADANGCQDTSSQVVEVLCLPIANFIWSPVPACVGLPTCFTDVSVAGGGSIISSTWEFDGVFVSLQTNPIYSFVTPGLYTVNLTVVDTNGCESWFVQTVDVDTCSTSCTSTGLNNYTTSKKLLKVTDILGRNIKPEQNKILFYIYNDGTVEKRIIIE